MAARITRDEMIERFIKISDDFTKYMARIDSTMKQINDTNMLHCRTLEANTQSIRMMTEGNNKSLNLIRWILVALVMAIIALAGAEKILKFL